MTSQWVMDEIQDVELLDRRLEQRYRKLLDSLSQASTASIPGGVQRSSGDGGCLSIL